MKTEFADKYITFGLKIAEVLKISTAKLLEED